MRSLLLVASVLWAATAALGAEEQKPREVEIKQGTIPFMDLNIAYQLYDIKATEFDAEKMFPTAVFLHGAKYASDFWVKLGTLQKVAESGVRALAIDLPGYGKTPALPYSDNNLRAELIKTVVEFAWPKVNSTLILVSPSMSGRYSIPFLDRYGVMITSYVAVAPIGISQWGGPWEDTHKRVCAMGVYGEEDPMHKDAARLVKLFEKSWALVIPGAGHRSYEDKPDAWHTVLLPFMRKCWRAPTGEHAVAAENRLGMYDVMRPVGKVVKMD